MAASISGLVLQNPCQSGFAHSAGQRRSKLQNPFKGEELKLNCGFVTRRKAQQSQWTSVLEKPIGRAGSSDSAGRSGDTTSAIAALERLIQQAQWQEERASDPKFGQHPGIERAVSELESDLNVILNALKTKEAELGEAKHTVKADQWDVQMARSALVNRGKALEAAHKSHSAKQDELQRAHKDYVSRSKELRNAEQAVIKYEAELRKAQEALTKKQEEFSQLQKQLLEKGDALEEVAASLKSKELELKETKDLLSKQVAENGSLQAALLGKDSDIGKMREDRDWKQEMLDKMENELDERTKAWSSAQDDLRSLEQELASSKVRGKARLGEISQLKVLLSEVQAELEESRSTIVTLRRSVEEQNKQIGLQEEDLATTKSMLASAEKILESAKNELEEKQEQIRQARFSYDFLQDELRQENETNLELQASLTDEKRRVQELTQELNGSKRLLQERDSSLSDVELALQLKETELVGTKLELQNIKSDLSSLKLTLSQKDIELQAAQKSVKSLQEEVINVRGLLQSKEDQLSKVSLLLKKKEEEAAVLRVDLNDSQVQLNQAASLVEHITELSRTLVDSTSRQEDLEESILMQRNLELVSTKRALFESQMQIQRLQELSLGDDSWEAEIEAEIQALKETLQKRDLQLLEAQTALASKDQEIQELFRQWDSREHELAVLREELIDDQKVLTRVQASQLQGLDPDTATHLLAAERAKLEAENAVDALRELTTLSRSFVQECQSSAEVIHASGGFQGLESAEDLKSRLFERDAALEITRSAMTELTLLTKRLIEEAGGNDFLGYDYESASVGA